MPSVPRPLRPPLGALLLIVLATIVAASPARAVLDIDDRGPVLNAGRFAMRVTNAGILGNAFFDKGLSFDPSFEYPRGSGIELLNHAELWVGGRLADGTPRVSGGPMLEWRPTLDPADRVLQAWADRPGTKRMVDDDADGRVDEETLNGRDDDGDGEIDEDLGMFSQQMTACDYVDDRPEAVQYVYGTGEQHAPLGLSVHQETYAWSLIGYDGAAGLSFHITNHGDRTVKDLYVGILADLDVRLRTDSRGHLDDRVVPLSFARQKFLGTSVVTVQGNRQDPPSVACYDVVGQTVPVAEDGDPRSGLPVIALVGLDHTIDPYAFIGPLQSMARAPSRVSFRYLTFDRALAPTLGGPPILDGQRYDALAGRYPGSKEGERGDVMVLVSCGPFASLAPGQSIDFAAALVAAESPDSLVDAMANIAMLERGTTLDLLPDSSTSRYPNDWDQGVSGTNGHELCLEPPPGMTFMFDPNCPGKLRGEFGNLDTPVVFRPGSCIWTDADCDECTGLHGQETVLRWLDPGEVPPAPDYRTEALDHAVRIAWDNRPEVLIAGGQIGTRESRFLGYRLYRIADWTGRQSLLPPPDRWSLVRAFGSDPQNGQDPLASITDTTLDYQRILYEQRLYPVGRYWFVDRQPKDGFPYLYAVTSVYELVTRAADGTPSRRVMESPLVATFDQAVTPHAAAHAHAGGVWVVPNPFRATAQWDLPVVPGDPLTRHLDFMGLPRARCVIKIWTVAGDLVAKLDHDGTNGDGEAAWDLVSRNGQDVVSGIYVFTVDSALGHQVGRFVVIR